jgi:hypothetical protein
MNDDFKQCNIVVTVNGSVSGNPTVTCGNQSQNGTSVTFVVTATGTYTISALELLGPGGGRLTASGSVTVGASDTSVSLTLNLN